jgi:hypothetical protein
MSAGIDFKKKQIMSSNIIATDCFNSYKNVSGLKGLMLLRFDILKYFYFYGNEEFKHSKIKITDIASVELKYSKTRKNLLVSRIFNESIPIPLVSIYAKYCDSLDQKSNEFRKLEDITNISRSLKYGDILELFEDCSDFYIYDADMLFSKILEESEKKIYKIEL